MLSNIWARVKDGSSGPSIVVVDEGIAKSLSTSTARSDVYAFFFSQKGLMAGLGLQGSKIAKIKT